MQGEAEPGVAQVGAETGPCGRELVWPGIWVYPCEKGGPRKVVNTAWSEGSYTSMAAGAVEERSDALATRWCEDRPACG